MELKPRFHQELFVKKTINKIKEGHKNFLWGWKCRAGKTYGVGHLIEKYYETFHGINALIITPAPSETLSQFGNEMFDKFTNFRHFNVIEIKKGIEIINIDNQKKDDMNKMKNNVFVISKQLLNNYLKMNITNKKKLYFHHILFDLIIFDENHFGGTTENSKEILKLCSSENSSLLFLTATYQKTLVSYKIDDSCQFFWNVEDETYCKQRNIDKLMIKHGYEDVSYFLNIRNNETKLRFYDNMPEMHLISTLMDENKFRKIKDSLVQNEKGFSMDVLFCMDKKKNTFIYENEIKEILKYICGEKCIVSDEKCIVSDENKLMNTHIYKRIVDISKKKQSRTILTNENFTTQLWFLPFGIGLKINELSKNLKNLMLEFDEFKEYEIMIINSKVKEIKNLKKHISDIEKSARLDFKKGLILLAGNQCSLGITLPLVDIVFLMNNISSSDKIIQMMYRCMSETSDGTKKIGFVVDFNINRVLHTFTQYPIHSDINFINSHKKISYMIENNLIHLDEDIFESRNNKNELIEKLLIIWKNDPENEQKMLEKRIKNINVNISNDEQKIINENFCKLGNSFDEHFVRFDDEIFQNLPKGRNRIPVFNNVLTDYDDCEENNECVEDDLNNNDNISLQEDILPLLLPLIVFMNTENDGNCDNTIDERSIDSLKLENINIKNYIDFIKENDELREVINEYMFMLWEKKNLFDFIYVVINKFLIGVREINNILYQFRMVFNSLINKPDELATYLKNSLKPKELEKKKFGEVFTPNELIDEMMDKLDEKYKKENKNKSIFSNSTFLWYDPSAGMGGFIVNTFYRLMKGLEGEIKDEEKRKKHILENMLYMSEINKKNCYILGRLFHSKKYKLNIYCGDSLKINLKKAFNIDRFDVIMGNPPYNKGGIKAPGSKNKNTKKETIWTDFVQLSVNEMLKPNGHLLFIHPLSWLRKTNKVHDLLCNKYIYWMKLMDASQSKIKINGEIAISLYVLENKMNVEKKKTEIHYELRREELYGNENYYIDSKKSIPLAHYGIYDKLNKFINDNDLSLIVESKTSASYGKKMELPKKYKLEDKFSVDTFTLKDGLLVKKSKDLFVDANKNKIIIANKTNFAGMFVDNGKLGMTGSDKFYILGSDLGDLKKLMNFMNYKIFKLVIQFMKYRMYFLDKEAFEFIPDIRKCKKFLNEKELYEKIGLNRIEMNAVENM